MSRKIEDAVRDVIVRMAPVNDGPITAEMVLVDDLGYTSLALLELAIQLEAELALPSLDAGLATGIRTVGDVERLVSSAVGVETPICPEE